jgi:hypothetical protein
LEQGVRENKALMSGKMQKPNQGSEKKRLSPETGV